MFGNVIVGVDGGSHGRDAIALAKQLLDPGGDVTLAHVHRDDSVASRRVMVFDAAEREAASGLLERERAETESQAHLISIAAPSVGRGLHALAEERQADLLVVGSCHRGHLGRAMLGDDTRAALNGAPCAVAIAPRGYAEKPHPFATIGVAYDESPESNVALAAAGKLASHTFAKLRAHQVVSAPTYTSTSPWALSVPFSMRDILRDTQARMAELAGVEGSVGDGVVGEEQTAFSGQVDLLVAGSRGYGALRRLVIGSTSNFLMRHSHCPLLVLPPTAVMASGSQSAEELDAPSKGVPAAAPLGPVSW